MSINYQIFFICWRLCYFIFSKDFEKFQDETSLKTQTRTLYHIYNLHKIFKQLLLFKNIIKLKTMHI